MSPRPEQIYTSTIPPPPLPRASVFDYLFPPSGTPTAFPTPKRDIPAFIDGLTGRTLTRGDIEAEALALAGGLAKLGVKKGEVACLFGMNSLEWVNACLGCQARGVVVSPANYAYTPTELLHQLRDSTSAAAFVQPAILPTLLSALKLPNSPTLPDDRIILLCDKASKPAELGHLRCTEEVRELGKGVDGRARWEAGEETKTAYLCYSSGTTGQAKGVETSHHNITSQVQAVPLSFTKLTEKDVSLGILPYSHIYGLTMTVHVSLTSDSVVVSLPRFEEASVLNAIQKYKVTFALVVPPMMIVLLHSPNVAKYDISSLRGFQSGAAPLSADLISAFESKYPHIKCTQGYGLTETSPVAAVMSLEEAAAHTGYIGKILPTFQARLVGEDGKDVEKGGRGELWLRGPSVMKGYWRNEKATSGVFAEGGWFKTGDVATVDDDGYFMIVDRMKELIKYKGFQVPPAELEALLLTHPEVADVGVIGVWSKDQATELPRAYIVPTTTLPLADQPAFSQQILDWAAGRVANHKKLRGGVVLVEAIPKSPSGKILRKDLRAMAVKEEEERVKGGRSAKL
ncbi:hypothetical protein IAT38_007178 [Cryptococcus sp. DSM 104549]